MKTSHKIEGAKTAAFVDNNLGRQYKKFMNRRFVRTLDDYARDKQIEMKRKQTLIENEEEDSVKTVCWSHIDDSDNDCAHEFDSFGTEENIRITEES